MKHLVLLASGNPSLVSVIKKHLVEDEYDIIIARTSADVFKMVKDHNPSVVLLDTNQSELQAEAIHDEIQRLVPGQTVIVLADKEEASYVSHYFKIGVDDVMVKPLDPNELIGRINARIRCGDVSVRELATEKITLDEDMKVAYKDGKRITLTPREYSLLKYLIMNKDRVVTREMILNNVWGFNTFVESRNVDVYIGYLRRKLSESDTDSDTDIIKTVRGFGYQIL
ncbi:MAG: response regulator transcription factor [Candidatus Dojkabacteria bacterium]|nr:response regulator transcription factor [Candidatus Dojkabacteria bacterium]